jgi:hypothetical protein
MLAPGLARVGRAGALHSVAGGDCVVNVWRRNLHRRARLIEHVQGSALFNERFPRRHRFMNLVIRNGRAVLEKDLGARHHSSLSPAGGIATPGL